MGSVEGQDNGKLVALEGDGDAISTQLRLLPPSQKILILPSSLRKLANGTDEHFNARSFVRTINTAFSERTETAQAFLRASTSSQPRLVFMNGGSSTARAACIEGICENLTNGNAEEAETIFNDIVKDGLAGLMREEEVSQDTSSISEPDGTSSAPMEDKEIQSDELPKSSVEPLSRTANIPILASSTTGASEPVKVLGIGQGSFGQFSTMDEFPMPPAGIFATSACDNIVTTILTVPNPAKRKRDTFGPPYVPGQVMAPPKFSNLDFNRDDADSGSEDDDELDALLSQVDDSLLSVPPSPTVEYGEACIVDVQATPPKTPELLPATSKSNDQAQRNSPEDQMQRPSLRTLVTARSWPGALLPGDDNERRNWRLSQLPRTTFMKASETTIRRSPTSSTRSGSTSSTSSMIRVFIDRGTDARNFPECTEAIEEESSNFEPVFPVVEDLVIYFRSEQSDKILDFVIQSYKNGSYSGPVDAEVSPISPTSTVSTPRGMSPAMDPVVTDTCDKSSEFDPYSSNNDAYPNGRWSIQTVRPVKRDSAVQNPEPLPPLTTPPPLVKSITGKFYDFNPTYRDSVIGVQDSLRAFLGLHFPASETGYSQHCFPVIPEAERLWKSVWSADQSEDRDARSVDQIIALGCDDGVRKDFFGQISGQVEKLGTKRSGVNRSGRLDLRYLIASAMQTFSALPANAQHDVDPAKDSILLATLLIPHLEAYLATNANTRLLVLNFTAIHLPVVIALQKIVGKQLFKIAGIVDSSDTSLLSHRPRTPNSSHPLSDDATLGFPKPPLSHLNRSRSVSLHTLTPRPSSPLSPTTPLSLSPSSSNSDKLSFSRANFLLPSTATDAELATFLSSIWAMLMETSSFYAPEPDPKPPTPHAALNPKPPINPDSFPPVSYRASRDLRSPRETKISRLTGGDAGVYGGKHVYAASASNASIMTMQTNKSRNSVWREGRDADGMANFYIGEEDSDDDEYDRMVMGRAGVRPVKQSQKAGKKKALKWLGLA